MHHVQGRSLFCFFFQAEDGIRDVAVTGVQTCALPISSPEQTGTITYALNLTQHTNGVENIRSPCMLQILLGNIGSPGGGVTAPRGYANVQGATDRELLSHELPRYMAQPLRAVHPDLK